MAWAPDYVTVAELKSYLRLDDELDDAELALAIGAASRAIDHGTDRQFGLVAAPEERTYDVEWSRRLGLWVAKVDDLMTVTGLVVTVAGSAVAASGYDLLPRNAPAKGRPWERLAVASVTSPTLGVGGAPTILAEGRWGWTTVPDTIQQATLIQSSRFFKRRDSPYGIAGSPDAGSELRLLAKADPDVELMVRPYRRGWPYL